jgi:enoyl-CoA hydratase/carnithine racemase
MIVVENVEGVQVVRMDGDENRFNLAFTSELAEAVAIASGTASSTGAPLLLTGTGKFFCNGLDLGWLQGAGSDEAKLLFERLYEVLALLLEYPGATVAAINGHTFGAGAVLAAAVDHRAMREDRGFFCFPEVDLGMTFSPEFLVVLQAGFPASVLRTAVLSGRRYGGPAALELGLVDAVADEAALQAAAVDLVRDLVGKPGPSVAALRAQLVADALAVLRP